MWDGIVNGLNHVEEKVVLRSLLKVCSLVSNVRGGFVVSNEKIMIQRENRYRINLLDRMDLYRRLYGKKWIYYFKEIF